MMEPENLKRAANELWVNMDKLSLDDVWILMFKLPVGELKDLAIIYEDHERNFDFKAYLEDIREFRAFQP